VEVLGPWLTESRDVTHVSAGSKHSCAVSNGEVWCWGDNAQGQLGDGTTESRLVPVRASIPSLNGTVARIREVAAGNSFTCALGTLGEVFCWGTNDALQLGQAGPSKPEPQLLFDGGFTALTVGNSTALAVRGGALVGWGGSPRLECGDPQQNDGPRTLRSRDVLRAALDLNTAALALLDGRNDLYSVDRQVCYPVPR
jgi:alpha-tubulin suppressor-like RCC1 family protein